MFLRFSIEAKKLSHAFIDVQFLDVQFRTGRFVRKVCTRIRLNKESQTFFFFNFCTAQDRESLSKLKIRNVCVTSNLAKSVCIQLRL